MLNGYIKVKKLHIENLRGANKQASVTIIFEAPQNFLATFMSALHCFQAPVKITIEVNSIDLSCFNLKPEDRLLIGFGNSKNYKKHLFKFRANKTENFNNVWEFRVPNVSTNEFKCMILKRRFFRKRLILCKTNVKCVDFRPDETMNKTLPLETDEQFEKPPSINLKVTMESNEGAEGKDVMIKTYSSAWVNVFGKNKG